MIRPSTTVPSSDGTGTITPPRITNTTLSISFLYDSLPQEHHRATPLANPTVPTNPTEPAKTRPHGLFNDTDDTTPQTGHA